MNKKRVSIFSPSAVSSKGHGYIYAFKLISILSQKYDILFFTLRSKKIEESFSKFQIQLYGSKSMTPDGLNKKNFVKYGPLAKVIYGLSRIAIKYKLIREFFEVSKDIDIYHLFEIEYFSTFIYFIFHKTLLNKTIIGLHSVDFEWIKGRGLVVNLYKLTMRWFVSYLIKGAYKITVHGDVLREKLIKSFKVKDNKIIVSIPYGCENLVDGNNKMKLRNKLSLNNDYIYGLFFGILRESKGILELLNILPKLNTRLKLIIAGSEGDLKLDKINSLIKELNIKDRVIPIIKYLDDDEITDYFGVCDFVFITHKNSHIAFSGPLSLSVENSRPVVSTNEGQIGSFVNKYKIGRTFKGEDWNDLISVTNSFIENEEFKSIDKTKFEICRNENSWEKMAEYISEIYIAKI